MFRSIALAITCLSLLSGCGVFSGLDRVMPDRRTDYEKAESLPDLEIPPDLTTDAIQDRMAVPQSPAMPAFSARADMSRPGAVSPGIAVSTEGAQLKNAGDGKLYLSLDEELESAWGRVSLALEQAQFEIDEADQDKGLFHVRYLTSDAPQEQRGFWSKLAFWNKTDDPDLYRISLTGVGEKTEVVVVDSNGEWDTSEPAGQLLSRLHAQLVQL